MQLNQKFAAIQDAFIAMFPPPPVAGPRHHRRLQAADRGSRRPRLRGARRGDQGVHGQGRDRRRSWPACSPSYQVNVPQLYADIDRTKARQLGVAGHRRVRDAADLSRLALRQRLQQVRPHLFGARAGRRAVPRARRRHRPAQGALGHAARWCRSSALLQVQAERRAGARDALQRLPRRRHQRRRRRPASRPARRRRRSSASPPRRCRTASTSSGPI